MRSVVPLAMFVFGGVCAAQPNLSPTVGSTLSVRVQPIVTAAARQKFWDSLDGIAPAVLVVEENQSLAAAVEFKCGTAPRDLRDKLIDLNPNIDRLPTAERRVLQFIPCPYWYFGANVAGSPSRKTFPSIPVRKGEDLKSILDQFMGTANESAIKAVADLNPAFAVVGDDVVQKSGRLLLPYVTKPVRVNLQDDVSKASAIAEAIIGGVPANGREAVRTNISETEYQLVAFDDPNVSDPTAQCGASPDEGWPINLGEIDDAVRITRALLPTSMQGKQPAASIAIADTGLLPSESFVSSRLWSNPKIVSGMLGGGTVFSEDLHGASMVTRRGRDGDIAAPAGEYRFSRHGSDVARVIVEPGIRIASLDKAFGIAVLKLNNQESPYSIKLEAVPTALEYGRLIQATVINLSVVTGGQAALLDQAVAASYALVVVAAGNNRNFPESLGLFPPSLANNRHKLIVVGAHDWKGKLAYFSNRGTVVDILAPGCAIRVDARDGMPPRVLSGTSFAAPFVSYTAAILRSLGFTDEPALLRSRIIGAGRFDPALIGLTRFAVRLDIPRAIRYREDSYLPKGEGAVPVYGEVDPNQNIVCKLNGGTKSLLPRDIIKIIPTYGREATPLIWTQPLSVGPFFESACVSGFDQKALRFKVAGAQEYDAIEWSAIQDVVMRSAR